MARLTGSQFKALAEAIQDGFSTIESLEELAARLGRRLDEIGTGSSVPARIGLMIGWAQERDEVAELLQTARDLRPANVMLERVVSTIQPAVELECVNYPNSMSSQIVAFPITSARRTEL